MTTDQHAAVGHQVRGVVVGARPVRLGHLPPLARLRVVDLRVAHRDLQAGEHDLVAIRPRGGKHLAGWQQRPGALLAYLACDLNVRRASVRLTVHPNTVRYRLKRIGELTGSDPHAFSDLLELATVVRMARGPDSVRQRP